MSYKEEILQCGDSFDGCAGLENVQSFDEWIDFERRLRTKYKSGYVPSEVILAVRRKGYASEMLGLVLPFCRAFGKNKILVTCDKGNAASQRTIIKNGGVMENKLLFPVSWHTAGFPG